MKTLLIGTLQKDVEALLSEKTELTKTNNEEFSQGTFPEIEAVVLRTYTELKKEQLNKLPKLKYVVSCSVGINNLDLEELKLRNIELIHCPGTNANSVAEHTLYMILSLLRRKKPFAELKGKTVGIVGLGHIGKLVAKKLKGFEAKVIAFDVIEQDPEILKELQVEMKSFYEVLSTSELVTIHVPLNKHTTHLINKEAFAKMKDNIFFVNTSRAEVIDEEGLLENYQRFRGVALDVYSDNLQLEGALLTEHVAAQGEDSFKRMCLEPVEILLDKLSF